MTDAAVTVAERVQAQVRRAPDAVAVVAGEGSLTYAELDARADRLAGRLHELGAGPDVFVGVCLERSLDMAVGLLAVLKAGGACVPLDPTYPPDRLAFMVDDAGVGVVLVHARLAEATLAALASVRHVVELDRADGGSDPRPAPSSPRPGDGEDAAYVIYTSGSTGQPKGVVLTQRNLVNHQQVAADLYRLGPGDRVLQFCSIGFDVSIEEIFPTWAAGATVVLRPDDVPLLGRDWLRWLGDQRVTVVNLPTAYWHEWGRDLAAMGATLPEEVRLVVVGGERALGSAYRGWVELAGRRSRWVNAYGPTEATCMATVFEPGPGETVEGNPPIGRPLPGVEVRIVGHGEGQAVLAGLPAGLSAGLPAEVPAGETGELLIGGVGLARGYLNRPRLTAECFVVDRSGTRFYRTGDLVRQGPDGELEFVGRVDEQVKVRGFRIECGEIEAVLRGHPGVAEAAVVARSDGHGGNRLVAYVVMQGPAGGAGPAPVAALRAFLAERIPSYMVPAVLVALDSFPLTANGKVDRLALPDSDPVPAGVGVGPATVAPRTETEERVAAVWARVLGLERVGVDDDFFELGGHSLSATQVIARLREDFGTETPLRAMFEAPTVAGLAATLVAELDATAAANGLGTSAETPPTPAHLPLVAQPRPAGARFPLSLAQEQMWRLELDAEPPGLQNVTALHRFREPVDEAALRSALGFLVQRHDGLRTSFPPVTGAPVQVVQAAADLEVVVTDLSALGPGELAAERAERIAAHNATPFDIARAPLVRAELLRGRPEHVLVVTFDHLVCDGTSAYVFLSELSEVYEAIVAGRPADLVAHEISFVDFALWQRRWATEDLLAAQLDWWRDQLDGMPLGPAVPFDRVPQTPTRRIGSRSLVVAGPTYRRLGALARATHSTLFVLCAASVQAVCHRAGATTDVVLSTTLSGRQRAELEGVMGMFAGIGRIRTDVGDDPTFVELVARARETVLGMFEHQDVPFMRVRQAVFPDFPTDDPIAVASAVPVDFQYFHTTHDRWAPGAGVVERPGADRGDRELYFRGQLHPLSFTLLDDGTQLWGELRYKADFYDEATVEALASGLERLIDSVAAAPTLRLSQLPHP